MPRIVLAAVFSLLAPLASLAAELSAPTGEPVLTVTGMIAQHNQGDAAVFDLDMLKALGTEEITTGTIWTEGKHVFTGVSLARLLDAVEPSGKTLMATAINDYMIDLPVSDAVAEGGPILAFEMDGTEMTVRDKGPLWLIYPYDSDAKYRSEVIYTRSVWQLDRIEVTE